MPTDKRLKLGMNPSTANYRLLKDLLFKYVVQAGHVCHRCGKALTRETFSIEHKISWAQADDPVASFFDLGNVTFSHFSCNSAFTSRRKYVEWLEGDRSTRHPRHTKYDRLRIYSPAKRRQQYLRTGK